VLRPNTARQGDLAGRRLSGPVGQGFARVGELQRGEARDEVGDGLAGFWPETKVSGVSVSESSGLRAPRPEVLGWGLTGGYGGGDFGEFDSRLVSGEKRGEHQNRVPSSAELGLQEPTAPADVGDSF